MKYKFQPENKFSFKQILYLIIKHYEEIKQIINQKNVDYYYKLYIKNIPFIQLA